jgi:O-antigen ligase
MAFSSPWPGIIPAVVSRGDSYAGARLLSATNFMARPTLAGPREPRSTLAWLALTLCSAAVVGTMLGRDQIKFALLPIGLLMVLFLAEFFARAPIAGYVAVLLSVGTAVGVLALPEVGVSSLKFAPAEILLWIVLGSVIFSSREVRSRLRSLAKRRESVVMAIFLAAVLAGVAVGVSHGASAHVAIFDMRFMLFYAAFWPAAVALSIDRGLVFKLVSAAVVVVVILQVIQVCVGPSPRLFAIASSDLSSTLTPEGNGFLRVRPPGLTTVYVVAAFALARLLWGPARHRLLAWAMTAVTLTGVILSFNRNMLLGLALGLSVAALIARQKHRFVVMLAVLAMVVSGVAVLAQGSSVGSNPIVARIGSITNYPKLKTQTLDYRYDENGIALQRIREHPITGLGWGRPWGVMDSTSDDGFVLGTSPRGFMHEQYLWIWMRAGIIGLLALVAALALGISNGARWFRARDGKEDAWLGAAIVTSVVAIAASSNVAIYLTPPDSIVPLVGVLALAVVLRRQLAR